MIFGELSRGVICLLLHEREDQMTCRNFYRGLLTNWMENYVSKRKSSNSWVVTVNLSTAFKRGQEFFSSF